MTDGGTKVEPQRLTELEWLDCDVGELCSSLVVVKDIEFNGG